MTKSIKISNKSLRQPFTCTEAFIQNVCKGACCRKSGGGTMITIHPSEEQRFLDKGIEVKDHKIVCGNRCPFQNGDGLCILHPTGEKPFGCVASPFTLNKNGTLILRNRYRLFRCYKAEGAEPAYKTFRASLDIIFGKELAEHIVARVQESEDDFFVDIDEGVYNKLQENDAFKKPQKS